MHFSVSDAEVGGAVRIRRSQIRVPRPPSSEVARKVAAPLRFAPRSSGVAAPQPLQTRVIVGRKVRKSQTLQDVPSLSAHELRVLPPWPRRHVNVVRSVSEQRADNAQFTVYELHAARAVASN